jgi:hypothetical protein
MVENYSALIRRISAVPLCRTINNRTLFESTIRKKNVLPQGPQRFRIEEEPKSSYYLGSGLRLFFGYRKRDLPAVEPLQHSRTTNDSFGEY